MADYVVCRIDIKPDGVYLLKKYNDHSLQYRLLKDSVLTEGYRLDGQNGLDREFVKMLFMEHIEIQGDHPSVARFRPCLEKGQDIYKESQEISKEMMELHFFGDSTVPLSQEQQIKTYFNATIFQRLAALAKLLPPERQRDMERDNMADNDNPSRENLYREELKKPLEEIKEEVFFRADNFRNEKWYGEFLTFTRIGVCQPLPEHALEVQKALKIMGYHTRTSERDGKMYIMPDTAQNKEHPAKNTGGAMMDNSIIRIHASSFADKELTAIIDFPATEEHINDVFRKLDIEDNDESEISFDEVDCPVEGIYDVVHPDASFEDINRLALLLEGMSEKNREILSDVILTPDVIDGSVEAINIREAIKTAELLNSERVSPDKAVGTSKKPKQRNSDAR